MALSFNEVIAELPRLTFEERQILLRRAVELDDPPFSAFDEAMIDKRLAAHHRDPSSVQLDELKRRVVTEPRALASGLSTHPWIFE